VEAAAPANRATLGRMLDRSVCARGALVAALVVGAALALSSCAVTDIPSSARTVTVYVDPPSASGSGSGQGGGSTGTRPSDVPTDAAPGAGVPATLAVGKQRGAPHSYDEALARIDGAAPADGITTDFVSPSGNIRCRVGGDPSGSTPPACDLAEGRVAPPLPTICPADGPKDIGRIELTDRGAFPVCNAETVGKGDLPTLDYGRQTADRGAPVRCISEKVGMTCVDTTHRNGFFVARETFVTF
jgi:hypothetical protein